jgi:predicted CXXCH cytochrome family protein
MHHGISSIRVRGFWMAAMVFLPVAGACFLTACLSPRDVMEPPEIAGARYTGNKVCADCHAPIAHAFPGSVHARVRFQHSELTGGTGCESCHGPGSKHVQAGGGRGVFIANPGKDPASCLRCHLDVGAQFSLPKHHPVPENRMNCVQCHDPHGNDILKPKGGLAMARLNESCARCHRAQTRPVVFEHPALREGCAACHSPHGSVNAKLLITPDPNLCLRCHAQIQGPAVAPGEFNIGLVPHAALISRGTCWSAGCHTAVHGSNVNPHLLY